MPHIILSIIVTHHKTPELLCLCLDSIRKTVKDIKHEVVVVDSESKKEAEELIREKHPAVKMIFFEKNSGYSKIVNAGLKKAVGDYILILNADVMVLERAIAKMLKYMRNHPDVGAVGPRLLDFTNNIQISCFSEPSLGAILARRTFLGETKWGRRQVSKFIQYPTSNIQHPIFVDWIQGSAIMVSRTAIEKVGLLDERFFMYFEDTDWCRRFWQMGYRVAYLPTAKMAHYYHRASKKWGAILDVFLNKRARIHIISAIKYFWKYRRISNKKKT